MLLAEYWLIYTTAYLTSLFDISYTNNIILLSFMPKDIDLRISPHTKHNSKDIIAQIFIVVKLKFRFYCSTCFISFFIKFLTKRAFSWSPLHPKTCTIHVQSSPRNFRYNSRLKHFATLAEWESFVSCRLVFRRWASVDGHSPSIFDLINSPSPFPPRFKEMKNAELRSRVNSFAMRRFGEPRIEGRVLGKLNTRKIWRNTESRVCAVQRSCVGINWFRWKRMTIKFVLLITLGSWVNIARCEKTALVEVNSWLSTWRGVFFDKTFSI